MGTKEIEDYINKIRSYIYKIRSSDFINFRGAPKNVGVYILYKNSSVVYIGSTKSLKRRLNSLFSNNPKRHVLNKRVKQGYYKDCSVKILEINDIHEARALEYLLIAIF